MKKTRRKPRNESYERLTIKWEGMRRDKKYISDFNKYSKEYEKEEKKYKGKSLLHIEFSQFYERWAKYFAKEYDIAEPIDPTVPLLNFDKFVKKNPKYHIRTYGVIDKYAEYWILSALRYLNETYCYDYDKCSVRGLDPYSRQGTMYLDDKITNKNTIKILVPLNAPLKKTLLEVGEIIKRWQNAKMQVCKTTPKRLWLEEHKKYLEIYDLKTKLSWRKIANRYYGHEVDLASATRKIMRYHAKGKKLVDGGYRQIT